VKINTSKTCSGCRFCFLEKCFRFTKTHPPTFTAYWGGGYVFAN